MIWKPGMADANWMDMWSHGPLDPAAASKHLGLTLPYLYSILFCSTLLCSALLYSTRDSTLLETLLYSTPMAGWFLAWTNPNIKWMICGYPHFRKPPYRCHTLCAYSLLFFTMNSRKTSKNPAFWQIPCSINHGFFIRFLLTVLGRSPTVFVGLFQSVNGTDLTILNFLSAHPKIDPKSSKYLKRW